MAKSKQDYSGFKHDPTGLMPETRFIAEFEEDILKTVPFKPGDVLHVKAVYLAEELDDVLAFAKVVKAGETEEHILELGQGSFYDPDLDDDDCVENLADLLETTEEDIRARMERADI